MSEMICFLSAPFCSFALFFYREIVYKVREFLYQMMTMK